jgi:hypothetical protein
MQEHIQDRRTRGYVLYFLWFGLVFLVLGVETMSLLAVTKINTLHLADQPWFPYFLPLFMGLPFLLSLQIYKRMSRPALQLSIDRMTLESFHRYLLGSMIFTYVGFSVLLGFLQDAIYSLTR